MKHKGEDKLEIDLSMRDDDPTAKAKRQATLRGTQPRSPPDAAIRKQSSTKNLTNPRRSRLKLSACLSLVVWSPVEVQEGFAS